MTTSVAINDNANLFKVLDTQHEDWIIARAIEITERRVFQRGESLRSPTEVRDFLRVKLAGERHEVFSTVFLDSQHRVIAFEALFKGTIDASSVYPRVVLCQALEHNAAAVIFVHYVPRSIMGRHFLPGPISISRRCGRRRPVKKRRSGLGSALQSLGLTFEGRQHRGEDDACNIARLLPNLDL